MPSTYPNPMHLALHAAAFDMKGFKTWRSREGGGYQFTLLFEAVPVALVTEDGDGGPLRVEWHGVTWNGNDMPLAPDATPAQRRKAASVAAQSRKARAALKAIVAATPDIDLGHGLSVKADEDIVLGSLAEVADIRKLTKKKTAFAEGGKLFTLNAPYSAAVAAHVAAKYPTAVVLNTLPVYV
jgi:hypothetical protein